MARRPVRQLLADPGQLGQVHPVGHVELVAQVGAELGLIVDDQVKDEVLDGDGVAVEPGR